MKVFVVLSALLLAVSAAPVEKFLSFIDNRIVGGVDAQPNEFPETCSLQWVTLGRSTHICGVSVLSPSWVLTAAHCITESPSVGRLEVLCGVYRLDSAEPSQQRVGIQRNVIHPGWVAGGVGPDDIAVIRLSSPLTITESVRPVTLPAAGSIPSGQSTLSGWGSTSQGSIPSNPTVLQKMNIPIIPINECEAAIGGPGATPLVPTNVCTGPLTGGVSACSGDSGGPLIQRVNGNTVQIGVVSWGFTPCGSPNAPSVYARVSAYIDWIANNARD